MKILRNKWFWVGIVVLLICSIIFDLIVLNVWAVRSISSGKWDIRLVGVAGLLVISDAIGSISRNWKLTVSYYTRVIFIFLVVCAMYLQGFWDGLLFMSLVLILSRLVRIFLWVIKKGIGRFQRRGLLEEI